MATWVARGRLAVAIVFFLYLVLSRAAMKGSRSLAARLFAAAVLLAATCAPWHGAACMRARTSPRLPPLAPPPTPRTRAASYRPSNMACAPLRRLSFPGVRAATFSVKPSAIVTTILASPTTSCSGAVAYSSGNCPKSDGGIPTLSYGTVNGATASIPYLAYTMTVRWTTHALPASRGRVAPSRPGPPRPASRKTS